MKRLKKINLPTALQITAILIIFLFGYPGCSSNKELPKEAHKASSTGIEKIEQRNITQGNLLTIFK